MKPRQQRMLAVGLAVLGIAIAAGLTLRAFQDNMMFFIGRMFLDRCKLFFYVFLIHHLILSPVLNLHWVVNVEIHHINLYLTFERLVLILLLILNLLFSFLDPDVRDI